MRSIVCVEPRQPSPCAAKAAGSRERWCRELDLVTEL